MSAGTPLGLRAGLTAQNVSEPISIDSRFGRLTLDPDRAIHFSSGLLGMPDKTSFGLARVPSEKYERFSVLQSFQDHSLAFIVLPLEAVNPIIEEADFQQAARDLGVPLADILPLLIVSVHRDGTASKLSVNARAPILVRASMRVAAQYVFPHTKYQIRQMLSL